MKKVKAHLEKDRNGIFSVYIFDNPLDYSINGENKTTDENIADFEAVYSDTKKFYEEEGMPK